MPFGPDHDWTLADLVAILMLTYIVGLALSYLPIWSA